MGQLPRVLFARVGWMQFYRGIMPGDEKLIGGGAYNKNNVGSEVANFAPVKGRVYGYAQPPMNSGSRIALEKIDSAATEIETLKTYSWCLWQRDRPGTSGRRMV